MKPGGCNCSHIPKALERPTGLPNLQPSHEPPPATPGSQQAPITHKPNGSVEKKIHIYIPKRGGKGRDRREPLNYNRICNATLTVKRTPCNHMGQQCTYQPRIPLDNLSPRVLTTIRLLQTLQDAPSTKQTITDGQDTIKNASINATDHTPGWS